MSIPVNQVNNQLKLLVRGEILRQIIDNLSNDNQSNDEIIRYILGLNMSTEDFAELLLYLDKSDSLTIFPNNIGELAKSFNYDFKLALLQNNKMTILTLIDKSVNIFPELEDKKITETQRAAIKSKIQEELNTIIKILNIVEKHGLHFYYKEEDLHPLIEDDLIDVKSDRDDKKVAIVHRLKKSDIVRSLCGTKLHPLTKKPLDSKEIEKLSKQLSTEIVLYNAYLTLLIENC